MDQVADKTFGRTADLAANAFSAFYEDLNGMFDISACCTHLYSNTGKIIDLKPDFSNCVSVHHLQCKGTIQGAFDLLFDQTGMFVLAGIFVMLPEKRVLEYIRSGKSAETEFVLSAVKEAGDLLVGSWDRVFREAANGHDYFHQQGNVIGEPWGKPQGYFSVAPNDACFYTVCQVKIEPYPAFKCAAVFPTAMLPHISERPNDGAEPSSPTEASEANKAEKTDLSIPADDPPAASENSQPAAEIMAERTPAIVPPDDQIPPPASESSPAMTKEPQTAKPDIAETEDPISAATGTSPQEETIEGPGPVRAAIDELIQSGDCGAGASYPLTACKVMKPAVLWADPEDTVEHVMQDMHQHEAGYALIGQDGQVQGIVSRSDTAAAVSPYLRNVFAHLKRPLDDASLQIRIKWFMSKPVHTVGPDTELEKVIGTMVKYGVRGVPVVDREGGVLGLITVFDVLQALTAR